MRGTRSHVGLLLVALCALCTSVAFWHGPRRNLLLNRPRIAWNARPRVVGIRQHRRLQAQPAPTWVDILSSSNNNTSEPVFIPSAALSGATERAIREDPEMYEHVKNIPYHVLYMELRNRKLPIVGDNVEMFARMFHHDIGLPYTFGDDDDVKPPEVPAAIAQLVKSRRWPELEENSTVHTVPRPPVVKRMHDGLSRSEIELTVGNENQAQSRVKSYVVKSPQLTYRDAGRRLLVLLSDVKGYNRRNVRKFADAIAKLVDSIVVVPDMFHDDPLDSTDAAKVSAWSKRHRPRQIEAEMYRFMQAAKDRWNTTLAAVVGVGFGADIALNMAAQHAPMNRSNVPHLLEPSQEKEFERDATGMLLRRTELETHMHEESNRRIQAPADRSGSDAYEESVDLPDLKDFNISELIGEDGQLKEFNLTDDGLLLDHYIDEAVEQYRREEEAEYNQSVSGVQDHVVERLIDDILCTGHKDAVPELTQILLGNQQVLPQLLALKERLINETKAANSVPVRLAARQEWYTAGPDAVVAICPSLTRTADVVKNLAQPVMVVQAGLGTLHKRAEALFEAMKRRPSPPQLFFATYKECSPTFVTAPRDTDEERCSDQVHILMSMWLDANLRRCEPFEFDNETRYKIIGLDEVFPEVMPKTHLTDIHDHLPE